MEGIKMRDDNCIFCKIANGDIPSETVYEDERFRVILDLAPAAKGHALILPKDHFANLYEIDDDVLTGVSLVAKKVARAMKAGLNCEGLNIVQNNGELAGQTVFHYHMHVIPRYADDGQVIGWKPGESTPEGQAQIASSIRAALS